MSNGQDKPFVIGSLQPAPRTAEPEKAAARASTPPACDRPSASVWWLLTVLLVAVTAGAVYLIMQTPEGIIVPGVPLLQSGAPVWLIALIAAIVLLQLLPLFAACRRAARHELNRIDLKRVQFLCEMPMYLGLFGSLLAVCATQFVSGTLVAPLAYATSMTGILLYLIARLTIALPLAEQESRSA